MACRWKYGLAKKYHRQNGVEVPDKAATRAACLADGVVAPDLATIHEFLCFYALGVKCFSINSPLPVLLASLLGGSLRVSNG
jgi:hypothetical protein